eukprot:s849_g4.t2
MMLPARLQKMAAHRMRLKLSRKVVQVPEMPMIETSLDVLFLNHSLRPPLNELYLKETKAFYTSKIHFFNGKHWQLRTLTANGKHYIMHFLPHYHRSMWQSIDQEEPSSIVFNLAGHELAEVIVECNGLVRNIESVTEQGMSREFLHAYRQATIVATAKGFAKLGATVDTIEREISAMSADPMTAWDEASLPVPDELWVNVYQNDIDCDNFLKDGSMLSADVIILATGYQSMAKPLAQIFGEEIARKVGPVWGLGSGTRGDAGPWEGELRAMWKPTGQENLWLHGGNFMLNRLHSHHLALQLKARQVGLNTTVF